MESPKDFPFPQKPADDQPIEGGNVIATGTHPSDTHGDSDAPKKDDAGHNKDGKDNAASQPVEEVLAVPISEPAHK